jgi:hypothetical protein
MNVRVMKHFNEVSTGSGDDAAACRHYAIQNLSQKS